MLCSFPVQMMWSFCDDSFLLFTNDLQTAGKSLRNVSPSGKEFILVNIDFSIDTELGMIMLCFSCSAWKDAGTFGAQLT